MRRVPEQPCPELSWDRTSALHSPRVLAGLWNSVTPVSTWGVWGLWAHQHKGWGLAAPEPWHIWQM